MAVKFLDNLDLADNQLLNARLENIASDPGSANAGDIIYNSTSNLFKYYNGSSWVDPTASGGYTSWTLQGDSGSNQTITDGTTVDWAGGTGITTATTSNTLTVSLDEATSTVRGGIELFSDTDQSVAANSVTTTASRTYGLQLNSSGQGVVNVPWTDNSGSVEFVFASTTGSSSTVTSGGTMTFAAGSGITTTNNGSGTITIAATGSGSMSSFTLTGDSGSNQTITDGETLDVAGGTNISTVVGATDTVTVNLDDSVTLAGELTVSGTGQSSFGGQVTVPTTPSASTDAASKAYVDTATTAALLFQGGYNATTNSPDLDSSPSASIKKGWTYVVTVAGTFFTEAVEVGDLLISEVDAPTTLADWVTVQNNVGLATASTVGIGNVNVDADGTSKAGLALSYSAGTATVGVDISGTTLAAAAAAEMEFLIYDGGDTTYNKSITIESLITYFAANLSRSFAGTSSSGTTHTFNHNLNSYDVIVQVYDASNYETVYASVDRTSVNQVVVTTAATANIRCLVSLV